MTGAGVATVAMVVVAALAALAAAAGRGTGGERGNTTAGRGEVTYDGRALILDGARRMLFSGDMHYPRSTPEVRMYAVGCCLSDWSLAHAYVVFLHRFGLRVFHLSPIPLRQL